MIESMLEKEVLKNLFYLVEERRSLSLGEVVRKRTSLYPEGKPATLEELKALPERCILWTQSLEPLFKVGKVFSPVMGDFEIELDTHMKMQVFKRIRAKYGRTKLTYSSFSGRVDVIGQTYDHDELYGKFMSGKL